MSFNKEGILLHKEVFDAWLNGAVIEYSFTGNDGEWSFCNEPSWNVCTLYRVHKEPTIVKKYIPIGKQNMGELLHHAEGVYGRSQLVNKSLASKGYEVDCNIELTINSETGKVINATVIY